MKEGNKEELIFFIEYEVVSHWLFSWISIGWMQRICSWYIYKKTVRKYNRYVEFHKNKAEYEKR
jgi:hypothetical protein